MTVAPPPGPGGGANPSRKVMTYLGALADGIPSLKPGAVFLERPERFVADCLSGKLRFVNATGYEVVRQLGTGLTTAEIAKRLSIDSHTGFGQTLDDVRLFLDELTEEGFVIWDNLNQLSETYWAPIKAERQARVGMDYVPGLVYWEFTNDCNLRCFMCYNESGSERPVELNCQERRSRLEELVRLGTRTVIITGGEPCTKLDDLYIFLNDCAELNVITQVFTNGYSVSEEVASALAERAVSHVRISIHGASPQTHDAVTRVRGSFDRAMKAAVLLQDAGIRVTWQMTASKVNFQDIRLALERAIEMKLYGFRLGSLDPMGFGAVYKDMCLSGEDEARLWRFLDEASIVCGNSIRVGWGGDYCMNEPWEVYVTEPIGRGLIDPLDPQVYMRFCKTSLCGTGIRSIGIRADGSLIPCPALSELVLARPEQPVRTAWADSPLLQKLRRHDLAGFDVCGRCGTRYVCGAGCRAVAYHCTGSITGPDPRRCRGTQALPDTTDSGFYSADEMDVALRSMHTTLDRSKSRWFNDVRTEGRGPWVPYWAVIARKWDYDLAGDGK